MEITTELVFSMLQKEKATGELAALQKDFYMQIGAFLEVLKKDTAGEDRQRQFENVNKMLISLKEKRKQKLLLYLAYGKPLPAVIPEEEETLFNELRQLINRDDFHTRISRLKITSDIPEVLTTKGRKIGPFKQGEIVEITNSNDAEFMVKNKIGEPVS